MDDRLKESISALMDDEANELELQRVLSKTDDDEVTRTWQRYHQVRSVLRGEGDIGFELDVRQSIFAALDKEYASDSSVEASIQEFGGQRLGGQELENGQPLAASERSVEDSSRWRWGGGLALAASVVFALVVTLQYGNVELQNVPVVANISNASTGAVHLDEGALVSVAEQGALGVTHKEPKIMLKFSDAHKRRFNEYLLRHAEQSSYGSSQGIIPLARVASVNSVGI